MNSRTFTDFDPARKARNCQEALVYLERCGRFTEEELREANRMAGGVFTEIEIQQAMHQAALSASAGGPDGGVDEVRKRICTSLSGHVAAYRSFADMGMGSKRGCLGSFAALLALGAGALALLTAGSQAGCRSAPPGGQPKALHDHAEPQTPH